MCFPHKKSHFELKLECFAHKKNIKFNSFREVLGLNPVNTNTKPAKKHFCDYTQLERKSNKFINNFPTSVFIAEQSS